METNLVGGTGQLYVVLGAALAGLALLFTLILLICLCNKHRSNGSNDAGNYLYLSFFLLNLILGYYYYYFVKSFVH